MLVMYCTTPCSGYDSESQAWVGGLEASPQSEVNVLAKWHLDLMSGSGLVGRPVRSTLTDNTISIPVSGAGDHFLREPSPSTHAPLYP